MAAPLVAALGFSTLAMLLPGMRASASPRANPPGAEDFANEVIVLTNVERAQQGLPPLRREQHLHDAAMWYAQDMADNDWFDHTDRQGRDPGQRVADFGYSWSAVGENIAAGQPDPQSVVEAWMNSPGHRANILASSFREIGAGYGYADNDYGHFWVQDFGARSGVYPVVVDGEAPTTTSSSVSLYLYGSGWAEDYRLSNDGASWTAWAPFVAERTWNLAPGAGERTVYAEIRRGGQVRSASDDIEVLDAGGGTPSTPAPTATATGTPAPSATTPATATATGTPAPSATTAPTSTEPPTASPTAEPSATGTAIAPSETPTEGSPTASPTATELATAELPAPTEPSATETASPTSVPPSPTPSPTLVPPSPTDPPKATQAPSAVPTARAAPGRVLLPITLTRRR